MPDVIDLHTDKHKDFASDLDEIAREGARRMLAQALEAEVADYIARHQERDETGRARVVRNGKARARKVTLGSGTDQEAWANLQPELERFLARVVEGWKERLSD